MRGDLVCTGNGNNFELYIGPQAMGLTYLEQCKELESPGAEASILYGNLANVVARSQNYYRQIYICVLCKEVSLATVWIG